MENDYSITNNFNRTVKCLNIIIVGLGRVGMHLAKILSSDIHNVVAVEINETKVKHAQESFDMTVINGYGVDYHTLERAGIKDADMLIALTSLDEINIVACQIAARYGVKQKIARIRNPHFYENPDSFTLKEWGIDTAIQPELETAKEIVLLIKRSAATDVIQFADERIQVIGIRLDPGSPVLYKTMEIITQEFREHTFRVVAIVRNNRTIIPTGSDTFMPRDQIFIIAETTAIPKIVEFMGKSNEKLEQIIILGGGKVGRATAHLLEQEKDLKIKLIDSNPENSYRLAEELKKTLVIQGDGRDFDLLAQEGVMDADALISVTSDEETNILTCLLAKHLKVTKTISLINRDEYMPIMAPIGINAAVNTNVVTSNTILRLIRRGNLVSLVTIAGVDAEIMEYKVSDNSKLINKSLSQVHLPKNTIVGAITRDSEVLIPVGSTIFQAGDLVVIFTLPQSIHDIEKIFHH